MRIHPDEINSFLQIFDKPPGVFLSANNLENLESNEIEVNLEDFVKSQMDYKITKIEFYKILASYCLIRSLKLNIKYFNFEYSKYLKEVGNLFYYKFSVIGIYIYLRYNIKIRIETPDYLKPIMTIKDEVQNSSISNISITKNILAELMEEYDISLSIYDNDLDLEYLSKMYTQIKRQRELGVTENEF